MEENRKDVTEEKYVEKTQYFKLLALTKTLEKKIEVLEEMLVILDGANLQYIDNQTDRLVNLALDQDPMNLMFVRDKKPTYCKKAVKANSYAAQFCTDPDLYKMAVKKNGFSLEIIPETYKTPLMCMWAVEQNVDAAAYVPTTKLYLQVWRCAIYKSPSLIGLLDHTDEIYQDLKNYAFQCDPMVYPCILDPTEEMTLKYIEECPSDDWEHCQKYIKEENKTFKVRMHMFLKHLKFWYKYSDNE